MYFGVFFLLFKIDIHFKKYSYITIKSMNKLFRLYTCNSQDKKPFDVEFLVP